MGIWTDKGFWGTETRIVEAIQREIEVVVEGYQSSQVLNDQDTGGNRMQRSRPDTQYQFSPSKS